MNCTYHTLQIREAEIQDAALLCTWWNNGRVMEHAGFPNGLGIPYKEVAEKLAHPNTDSHLHIILLSDTPIGEIYYREIDPTTCEIGIKICDFSQQGKGIGKQVLSLFIRTLFSDYGYHKIILDTNLNNTRAQHVYEQLGFIKSAVHYNAWTDQLGRLQSAVDYELTADAFHSYL